MKRILEFKLVDSKYVFVEKEETVFEISKIDLQFNVKDFYQAFYEEGKDFEDISIINCLENDKAATRVYGCITDLMEQIQKKLSETYENCVYDEA